MTRSALAALVLALACTVAAAGCTSGDGDASASTTATTTTTKPEITDEEIIHNINEDLRPPLAEAFDPKAVDCIISVLEEGGTGKLDADAVVPEYESRCGVTATKVTGVITAAALVEQGATEEQGACVAEAVAKLTHEQVSALDEGSINHLYESCGVDVGALTGG